MTFAKWTTAPVAALSISHQGQFPATTNSFNLAEGEALGTATAAIQHAMQQLQLPAGLTTVFQGNAQAFQDSLTTVPLLILAALVCVYLILGVLYESFIHPLTILSTLPSAGLGALATLMLFGYEFQPHVALIGTILLDRHREEERDHDGRLRHLRRARGRPDARPKRSARRRCCAFRPIIC